MKRNDLTERMARQGRTTQAEAADQLDRVVHDILQKLRRGEPARLPGLGEIVADLTSPKAKGHGK